MAVNPDAHSALSEISAALHALAERIDRLAMTDDATANAFVHCPFDAIRSAWNELCGSKGMEKRNATGGMKARILAVWRAHPSLAEWRAAFTSCASNRHWCGENERGWRGSLESFLRPAHVDRWFDRGTGASEDSASGLFSEREEQTQIDDWLARFWADPKSPLPRGYDGPDPRKINPNSTTALDFASRDLQAWIEDHTEAIR